MVFFLRSHGGMTGRAVCPLDVTFLYFFACSGVPFFLVAELRYWRLKHHGCCIALSLSRWL